MSAYSSVDIMASYKSVLPSSFFSENLTEALLSTKILGHNPKRADGRLEMLLMELGQFWMIFTIGVSWLCLIPAKSVQTVYIAPVFFIALEVMGMGYKLVANGQCSFTIPDKTLLAGDNL